MIKTSRKFKDLEQAARLDPGDRESRLAAEMLRGRGQTPEGSPLAGLLGDDTFVYDANHFLLTSVHLPTVVQITDASREKPCLGLRLKLDLREISQLMVDSHLPPPRAQQSSRGMATGAVTKSATAIHRCCCAPARPRRHRAAAARPRTTHAGLGRGRRQQWKKEWEFKK